MLFSYFFQFLNTHLYPHFSSERNTRMTKVMDSVKFSLLESMTMLEDIWDEIGIKEDQKEQRNNTVLEHLQGVYYNVKHC